MAVNGVLGQNEMRLGSDFPIQVFTLVGTPTSGTFQLRYKNGLSTAIAYNDSANNFRDAIRALKVNGKAVFPLASVSRAGSTSADFVWTVTLNYGSGSVPTLIDVICSMSGSFPQNITVAVSAAEIPLRWKVIGSIAEGSVDAVAGKSFIANSDGVGQERTSQIKISEWVMEDFTAGLGYYDYKESESAYGFWDGDCITWIRGQITCAPLPESLTGATTSSTTSKARFNGIDYWSDTFTGTNSTGSVYRISSGDVVTRVYSHPAGAQAAVCQLQPYKSSLIWKTNISSTAIFTMDAAESVSTGTVPSALSGGLRFTIWDNKLFAITASSAGGRLYFTSKDPPSVAADWEDTGAVVPDGSTAIGLVTWQDKNGNAAVYVLTTSALWIYDPSSSRLNLIITGPFGGNGLINGIAAYNNSICIFQGDLIIVGRTTVFKWDGSTLTNIGPQKNYGLPTASLLFSQGPTWKPADITASNQWLFLCVVNTPKIVIGYNGQGWHFIVRKSSSAGGAFFSTDGARDGVYTDTGTSGVQRHTFADATSAPLFWTDMRYFPSSKLVTGWFDRGLSEVPKAGYYVRLNCSGLSSTETITVYYQIDYAPENANDNLGPDPRVQWKKMVDASGAALTINAATAGGASGIVFAYFDRQTFADGVTYYSKGLRFYKIRFRFDLVGSGSTVSPILRSATLGLDPLFEPLWGWSASLDLGNCPDGRSAEQARFDLRELEQSILLTSFAFTNTDVYQVRLDRAGLQLGTGANIASGEVGPVATIQVSERVSTR